MCGIYGMLHLSGASAAPEALRPMARRTIHRGPDDEGVYADGPLTFGMRRLSIIDVAGGHQPCQRGWDAVADSQRRDLQIQVLRRELTDRAIISRPPPIAKPSFICTNSMMKPSSSI
jgi:hypothetical protein